MGLNEREYVEVNKEYKWIGTNRMHEKEKSGGVGFIVGKNL